VILQCWIYSAAFTSDELAAATARSLDDSLDQVLADGAIAGYRTMALVNDDDFADEDIDRDLVDRGTGGLLPAVYVNVTYDLDRHSAAPAKVRDLMARWGLMHVLTDPPEVVSTTG
jgi:hypothetical protein